MTEAERLFNETHARYLNSWSAIQTFRDTFIGVAPTAQKRLHESTNALLRGFIEDPQWKGAILGSARPVDEQLFVKVAADGILKSSYASLDAAVLIFCHSVLDAISFDYCKVTTLMAPNDWVQELKNVQIPLLEARDYSYEHLLKAKLEKHLSELERKSLLAKVDRLFIRCQPPSGWAPITDYTFDRDRLEGFDSQRHEIVHGNALGKTFTSFPVTDESLWYLWRTGLYLMGLVNQKYGLRLDTQYIGDYLQGKAAASLERS